MSNEDQPTQWGMKEEKMLKPKSKGAGIMVSGLVDKMMGSLHFLMLNTKWSKQKIHIFTKYTCNTESIRTNSSRKCKE